MNENISEFIAKQTCGNLACVDEKGEAWCFSFFYSFDADGGLLFYKSSTNTRHSIIIHTNPKVSGTILPDKLNFLAIKGIQFEGVVLPEDDPLTLHASTHYHKKHPVALAMPGQVWTIRLDHVKFTDNSLGIGKKLNWSRQVVPAATENVNHQLVNPVRYKEPAANKPAISVYKSIRSHWDEIYKRFEDKLVFTDVRKFLMSDSVDYILSELDAMPDGKALFVYHNKLPVFLFPELAKRKLDYRVNEIAPGEVHLILFKP